MRRHLIEFAYGERPVARRLAHAVGKEVGSRHIIVADQNQEAVMKSLPLAVSTLHVDNGNIAAQQFRQFARSRL